MKKKKKVKTKKELGIARVVDARLEDWKKGREVWELELFSEWMPILIEIGERPGRMTAQQVVDKLGPLGPLKLGQLMMSAKSETVQAQAAKEISYMHGLKPIERSQSVNLNIMGESEVDAMLASKLDDLGIRVKETRGKKPIEVEVVGGVDKGIDTT